MLLCAFLLVLSAAGNCLAQSHFTRGVPSSDRSASELMTPPYQRRQDEYHLWLNCSPSMQHPASAAAYQVELTPGGRLHPSSGSRLTWLVKPSDAYDYMGEYLPLIAFTMDTTCSRADPVNPRSPPQHPDAAGSAGNNNNNKPQSSPPALAGIVGEYMAFVATQGCSVSKVVRAVRRVHRDSRVFMLHGSGDRLIGGDVLEDQAAQPNLCVFVYEQTPLAAQLAREMRNRTCSVSLNFRLGGFDSLINKTSVLFVSVSFILLMIISLSWLVFYYVQRFRYLHAKERLSRRLGNAAKKALTRIPVRVLKPGDRDFNWIGDQCAVCIEPYRVSDAVRILPCKHFYHRSCIDPWLLDQRTCPLCKLDILKAYGLQIRDRRGSHGSLMDGRLTPEENSQAPDSVADSVPSGASTSEAAGGATGATASTTVVVTAGATSCGGIGVGPSGAAAAAAAGDHFGGSGSGGTVRLSTQPALMAQFSSCSSSVCGSKVHHHQHHQQRVASSGEDVDVVEAEEVCYPLVHHHQRGPPPRQTMLPL